MWQCQRTKVPIKKDEMPLRPMMGVRAFAKWGIDFVVSYHSTSLQDTCPIYHSGYGLSHKMGWGKGYDKSRRTTAQFLYKYVFVRYGLPIEIVSDRGAHFINEIIEHLLDEFMIIHWKSAPYHPQANNQAEATNKTLCTVLTKIVSDSRTDWDQKLQSAYGRKE